MTEQTIIVPDSSPLITLGAARSLDVLIKPGRTVRIPDGVFWEATRFVDKRGVQEIIDSASANDEMVRISVIQEHQRYGDEEVAARKRIANHGERCTAELVDRLAERNPPTQSILIYEDGDVTLLAIANPDKVAVVTTAAFLDEIEQQRLIQSADHILNQAINKGRREGIWVRNAIHPNLLSQIDSGR